MYQVCAGVVLREADSCLVLVRGLEIMSGGGGQSFGTPVLYCSGG